MKADWRESLHQYLEQCDERPFDWVDHSCLTFATGAVVAMTGIDYWSAERHDIHKLETRADVLRYMSRYGGDLKGAATSALGKARAVQRKWPGEGDIVMSRIDGVDTIGVCLGRLCVFVGESGLLYFKPDNFQAAWSLR